MQYTAYIHKIKHRTKMCHAQVAYKEREREREREREIDESQNQAQSTDAQESLPLYLCGI
jgi:hypothetical protein